MKSTVTSPGTENTDVLIIGGGPAGIQATRLLKEKRSTLKVTVLRPEPHSLVYCALPYAMEGLFPLERTFKSDDLITGVGARLVRKKAVALDLGMREVTLEDNSRLRYDKLLIVTGAIPTRPAVRNVHLSNVLTLKTASDAKRIIERFPSSKDCPGELPEAPIRAVVIGSGAIGIEQATAYRARGVEVHLVEMRDHVLPHLLDSDMAEPLATILRKLGINLYLSAALEAIEGDKAARRVRLAGGIDIDLQPDRDFVVLAVGMSPDISPFVEAGLAAVADGLVVDQRMRTLVDRVWAAGDCVAFHSGIDGKPLGGKLATNAVPMAKVAARDMLGLPAGYAGFFNGAVTVVGGVRVGGTGFTETFAKSRGFDAFSTRGATKTRFPMMPEPGDVDVKLVFERPTGRLLGAQIIGDEAVAERVDLCTFALQRKATAWDLADLSYSAQPWQTFFPARNAIVEAATAACDRLDTEAATDPKSACSS